MALPQLMMVIMVVVMVMMMVKVAVEMKGKKEICGVTGGKETFTPCCAAGRERRPTHLAQLSVHHHRQLSVHHHRQLSVRHHHQHLLDS